MASVDAWPSYRWYAKEYLCLEADGISPDGDKMDALIFDRWEQVEAYVPISTKLYEEADGSWRHGPSYRAYMQRVLQLRATGMKVDEHMDSAILDAWKDTQGVSGRAKKARLSLDAEAREGELELCEEITPEQRQDWPPMVKIGCRGDKHVYVLDERFTASNASVASACARDDGNKNKKRAREERTELSNKLNRLLSPTLKAICQNLGVPSSGTKTTKINAITVKGNVTTLTTLLAFLENYPHTLKMIYDDLAVSKSSRMTTEDMAAAIQSD